MSLEPATAAERLWRLLPVDHRLRDEATGGDLRRLVDAVAAVLDDVRGTLDQRLAEVTPSARHPVFPPENAEIRVPQEWTLPYVADLLDVRLVSPDAEGQRAELAEAITWRKGAGTIGVAGRVAELLSGTEGVVVEGRSLVLTTPRVDTPLPPEMAFAAPLVLDDVVPLDGQPMAAAVHPALVTGTPVVTATASVPGTANEQAVGRAVSCAPSHPAAVRRPVEDERDRFWRHLNPRAVPCFPDSYEDPVVRTPDTRDPSQRHGRHHPRRVVVFLAAPPGFFTGESLPGKAHTFDVGGLHTVDRVVTTDCTVTAGSLWLRRSTVKGVLRITAPGVHRLDDVVVLGGPVEIGTGVRLECSRCALPTVTILGGGTTERGDVPPDPGLPGPLDATDGLVARDSLVRTIDSTRRVTLDGVTVLGACTARSVRASETILAGSLTLTGPPAGTRVRFSRVPPGLPSAACQYRNTSVMALFEAALGCASWRSSTPAKWGEPGCGVLDPEAPIALRTGAEDGGELGAYHHRRHGALAAAVREKLHGLLPVGIEPVIVIDRRLVATPPQLALQP